MMRLATAGAFLRRDFLVAISYQAGFAMQLFGIFVSVPIF